MNFLENLPGGRAGEANRSDPQSGVSRLIPVNVPVPVPVPEIQAPRVSETLVIDRAVGHATRHGRVYVSIEPRDP